MENTTTEPASGRAIGIKYGIFSALAGIVLFLVAVLTGMNPFQGVMNWAGIVISIGLLFWAHKVFKETGDGFMTYGQGLGIAFWYTLVSMVLSLLVMYVYTTFIDTEIMNTFYEEQRFKMEEQGQSEDSIDIAMEWTQKLFWPMAIIVGFLFNMFFALILTIFTQKKNQEPTF